jgi:DNA end-binding protein Ku
MAARATWKGYLKVSLVNIPIRVFPATDSAASISFNQLHGECQTRIQQKKWCPKCDREVPNSEIVKGYEFEKGRYVVVDEEDIEKVRPASTRVIDLQQFAERDELDPIFFERPYYLAPDTQVAADAFAVIREGMQGKVGIGKVALYGREYLVAVEAREKGLVMYTLRQADEIRAMEDVAEYDLLPEKPKTAEVQLARQVISTFEKPLDMKLYKDEYQAELRRIIDAKVAGEEVIATEEETPSKVVDLMEALRKSLASVSDSKKKPAKADIAAKDAKAPAAKKAAPKRKAG